MFLILILILTDANVRCSSNFPRVSISKFIFFGLFLFQLSFANIEDAGPRLTRELFNSRSSYEFNIFPFYNSQYDRSVGIAFTQQALSLSRTTLYEEFWMSTDMQKQGHRLLTASTKLQSKDFFRKSEGVFQGSTIQKGVEFWCDKSVVESYWIDVVVTTKNEDKVGKCKESNYLDLDNLRIYLVNSTPLSTHKVLTLINHSGGGFTSFYKSIAVEAVNQSLIVRFLQTADRSKPRKIEIFAPIQYSKNLIARQGNVELELNRLESGFTRIGLINQTSVVEFSYEPKITQRIRIIFSHMLLLFAFIMFFRVIVFKKLRGIFRYFSS